MNTLLTASDAARQLDVDRRTIASHARALGVGMRAGSAATAPILLTREEIEQISESIKKKSTEYNFRPGNDFWKLREKSKKKSRKQR